MKVYVLIFAVTITSCKIFWDNGKTTDEMSVPEGCEKESYEKHAAFKASYDNAFQELNRIKSKTSINVTPNFGTIDYLFYNDGHQFGLSTTIVDLKNQKIYTKYNSDEVDICYRGEFYAIHNLTTTDIDRISSGLKKVVNSDTSMPSCDQNSELKPNEIQLFDDSGEYFGARLKLQNTCLESDKVNYPLIEENIFELIFNITGYLSTDPYP